MRWRVRADKKTSWRRRQIRDCWLCFVAVLLLALAWLWYSNFSALSIIEKHDFGDTFSVANGCFSYGCPISPSAFELSDGKDRRIRGNNTTIVAAMTRKSNRQHPPVNQDAAVAFAPFITKQTPSQKDFFIGIFDGHGTKGHDIARYATQAVPERLAEKLNTHAIQQTDDWVVNALKETFVEVDAEAPPSALLGGCTASVTLRRGNKLFAANAGDSQTIIVSSFTNETEQVVYATRKDKPHLPDELERIRRLGGQVHIPPEHPMLSRVIVHSEAANDVIGLAMSRSIGDWEWGAVGVTPEPIVDVINVDDLSSAFVVAASDGLWDVRRHQFVAKHFANSFYRNGMPPLEACRDMIQKASPVRENVYRDDITIIALKLS